MGGVKEILSKRELYDRFGKSDLVREADPPEEGAHIWEWFWHLSSRRQQGFNGPQPMTYAEISAWSAGTGERLLREELAILIRMDARYLSALVDQREEQRKANEVKSA